MKHALIGLALLVASPAWAQEARRRPRHRPKPHRNIPSKPASWVNCWTIPQTKAIFEKYFPEVVNHPQINEGLDLTLPDVVQYLPDVVTPEKLAAMDTELKAIP